VASDSDSQVPIFLERLRTLFRSSADPERREDDPNRGSAIAVCVMLSVVLWLSLTLQEQRMVDVDFPVEVSGVPADKALTERPPSSVTVQLQGSGMDLLRLVFNPPPIPVTAGEGTMNVAEALSLPRANDARVESVTPRVIDLEMEPRIERRVPVRPRLRVTLASAYELIEPPILRPDSVTVSGAESILRSISAWPTDTLVLENVRDTLERTVPLRDTLSGLVDRAPERVTVAVRAGKFAEETREVTVDVTGVPAGQDLVALQPSTIRIRYRVLFDQLFASRRSSEFFASVSYSQIRSDTTGYVTPNIHVPSDLVIRDPEPIPSRLQYYTFLSQE
jgi:YbbR domain-containing protein